MRKAANFCDYFIICSGSSQRQVEAIADGVEEGFLNNKIKTVSPRDRLDSQWLILDYGDVIIHIFYKEIRQHYNLEHLWIDAPRVRIPKVKSI